jgi:O-antigen/teichoic acid export membrane protein
MRVLARIRQLRPAAGESGLSLTGNFIWTLGGNVFYAGCQWSVVVVLAKIASPEVVGQYALALAIGFPITFIANLQLRALFVTDLSDKYPFHEMLGLRYVLGVLAVVTVLVVSLLGKYGALATGVMLVVATAQVVDCLSENYYGVFQRNERLDRISVSLMMRHLLGASTLVAIVYFTHSLLFGVSGLVFGRGLIFLTYDARYGAYQVASDEHRYLDGLRPRWNLKRQLKMLWIALPLGVASILVSVNGNVPRYVIAHLLGRRELGIYSAISYIPTGAAMIATALGYAVFARLSKLFYEGNLEGFRSLLIKASGICAGLGATGFVVGALVGRQVLTLLYKPEYAQHSDLLLWLMVVGAGQCLASCLGCALTAASQFREQVPLFVGVTAATLIGCFMLVPRMHLIGAAVAVLISLAAQLLATVLLMSHAIKSRARDLKSREPRLEPAFELSQ